jgi:hypothetical protein
MGIERVEADVVGGLGGGKPGAEVEPDEVDVAGYTR